MRGLVVAAECREVSIDTSRDPLVVHVARVLVLVDSFTTPSAGLAGLPKLARLDFLLRFPALLETVLRERQHELPFTLRATYDERQASESAHVRWKYGPWDHRYYPLLGRLVGQELISVERVRGTMLLRSTLPGREVAAGLPGSEWELVRGRARALKRGANVGADRLGALIDPLLSSEEIR